MKSWMLSALLVAGAALAQTPLGTAFSYQGLLKDSGQAATGLYDLQACLFDALVGGAPLLCVTDLADVPVENGVFTVSLDFGSAAFVGQRRYLEIRVRAGASSGAYTTLTPRQLIAPAPEALRSASTAAAPWTGLSGVPLGFADGIDNIGTGTVSVIATGSGLSGGPISTTGTIAIATGGVSSTHIANAAVGAAQINPAQVQARIGGSCAIGTYLRAIYADGSVECSELPGTASIGILVSSALTNGEYSDIVIGNDGIPMISFSEFNAGGFFHSLKLARCLNPSCNGPATVRTIDSGMASVGTYNSMAIGADGNPVISYYDASARALKVAKCSNADCSGAITLSVVDDPANDVGRFSSLVIGLDGRPVISYRDSTSLALKVANCANPACTGSATITTLDDPVNAVGEFSSIAVGSDGLPAISYYDRTALLLKMAKCSNPACTAATLVTVDNQVNDIGQYCAMAVDVGSLPVISYQDTSAGTLKVAKCTTPTCSGVTRTIVDDPSNSVGSHTAIAIPEDGQPVISYYDNSAQALKVAKCANAACTGSATITTVDDPGNNVGQASAIAIAADGLPIISYRDLSSASLKVVKCASRACR
jgi:hypothetical protein